MDSTQIASNIVSASRLQLLVEAVQRIHHILSEEDKIRLAEIFTPYIKDDAGHYTYRVKGKEAVQEHLQNIGESIHVLLLDLEAGYSAETAYQVLERIFSDNFHLLESNPHPKENIELSSGCLQSVDDLEATYRTKGKCHYKGYVANVTETCDPENELQLVTKVQVASNNIDDAQLLVEVLPNLKERTDLDTLYTDGGYGSPEADQLLQDNQVEQIQTAIRGRIPSAEKLNLSDFEIKLAESKKPTQITCPQGQTVLVHPSSQRESRADEGSSSNNGAGKKGCVAHFEAEVCQTCPLLQKCPAQRGKRDLRFHLRFNQKQINMSQRRQRSQIQLEEGHNLRAAVEATIRQVKHPFPASKLPVRGRFRVTCMVIGSAMTTNVRRIQRYLEAKIKLENEQTKVLKVQKCSQERPSVSFFALLKIIFRNLLAVFLPYRLKFDW